MNLIFTILFLFISGTVFAQECTQPSCFQQKDKELTGLANTTSAADKVPWFIDANGNMDLAPFTAYGRSLVGAADAAAARTLLGVSVGGTAHEIENAGNPLAQRPVMNFTGAGVTASDVGGKTVVDVPGMGGHVIKNEGSTLATQPNLNFVGGGINCINDAGNSETECTVSVGGEVDPVVAAVNGVVKSSAGVISAATPDVDFARADTDTKALADNVTAGFWAAATNAARTMATADTNNLTWTNPAGVAGNPTIAVGPNVALTSRAFTVGGFFDWNFAAASSLTTPLAAGAAPTAEGRIATNTSTHRIAFGNGTITRTFAFTDEVQPLNAANLSQLAALNPIANSLYIYTGSQWSIMSPDSCSAANQAVTFDPTLHKFGCNTLSASGLSGTPNTMVMFGTAVTGVDSLISQSGSDVTVAGNLIVGASTFKLGITPTLTANRVWTAQDVGGLIMPCDTTIGNYTDNHILKVVKVAGVVTCADGGAAGAGDVTLNGVQELTNKTIKNADAGGTGNVVTIGIAPYWPSGSLILPSGSTCTLGAVAAINSGPSVDTVTCTDAATSIFEGNIALKQAVTTVTFTLTVNDVDSSSHHFGGGFKAMCRNNNTTVNNTWGTAQTVDITMATANNDYTGTTAAVTPNGTCSAGATLFWQFVVDAAGTHTDDGDARVIGVLMKQAS